MNKNITLMSSCLLLISTQTFADRPAMEDYPASRPVTEQTPEPAPSAVEMSMQHESANTTQIHTGDALEIHAGETLPVSVLDFPRRGMTMDKVKNEMGIPNTISDTVGEPPITSWIYADRIVYFEHSNVIHVVANN